VSEVCQPSVAATRSRYLCTVLGSGTLLEVFLVSVRADNDLPRERLQGCEVGRIFSSGAIS
jgi:hypothetical protein